MNREATVLLTFELGEWQSRVIDGEALTPLISGSHSSLRPETFVFRLVNHLLARTVLHVQYQASDRSIIVDASTTGRTRT